MSFKTVLRRNTDLRQESKRSNSPESPIKDSFMPIDSRIRVNSEPSRTRMPISLNKSLLPDIESSHKKAFIGAYINTASLLSRRNKMGSLYLRDKSPGSEDSPVQTNKVKKTNTSMEVYSNTPQRYKGLDISTDSVKKSLLQAGNFSPSPLKFKPQATTGRSITPSKPLSYELSDIASKAGKSRQYNGAAAKIKRVEQKAKPEPLSTSVNASPMQHRLDATKCSLRKNGVVEAYAANSNQGIVRNYNEDRVSIILNVTQPSFTEYQGEWPNCSFFGVYDGHGGSKCADFLKDNLHKFVMGNKNFPANPTQALLEGFREAEAEFLSLAQRSKLNVDQSGSCAVVALILDNKCYIANVGDSRAVLSGYKGIDTVPLSRDHKPGDENEQERIFGNGGKLYQSPVGPGKPRVFSETPDDASDDAQFGPLRVLPGRLAVSRTFGDIEAKLEKFGGNPNVVVAEPEIRVVELTDHSDFLVLASDGIFDRLSNEDVTKSVWDSMKHKCSSIHEQASQAAESIMMDALVRKTFDNITVVILAFAGFKNALNPLEEKKDAPNFYLPLEKQPLVKRATMPVKARANNLSNEMAESQLSEERAHTSTDESAGEIEKDTITNFSLESVHKARPQSITRQLIRAYKKSPVVVGPK